MQTTPVVPTGLTSATRPRPERCPLPLATRKLLCPQSGRRLRLPGRLVRPTRTDEGATNAAEKAWRRPASQGPASPPSQRKQAQGKTRQHMGAQGGPTGACLARKEAGAGTARRKTWTTPPTATMTHVRQKPGLVEGQRRHVLMGHLR
eukprot:Rmarinus@m.4733